MVCSSATPKDLSARGAMLISKSFPPSREPMSFETSVPGIFAIGDVRFGSTKRVATAVGEGAGAVRKEHPRVYGGKARRDSGQTPPRWAC